MGIMETLSTIMPYVVMFLACATVGSGVLYWQKRKLEKPNTLEKYTKPIESNDSFDNRTKTRTEKYEWEPRKPHNSDGTKPATFGSTMLELIRNGAYDVKVESPEGRSQQGIMDIPELGGKYRVTITKNPNPPSPKTDQEDREYEENTEEEPYEVEET